MLLFIYNVLKYKQFHIFFYFFKMNKYQKKYLIKQVNSIDWEKCFKSLTNKIRSEKISAVNSENINNYNNSEKIRISKIGEKKLKNYGVLLLAGGQGTRLGFDGPKGTFKLKVGNNDTFFSLYIKKILKFEKKYNVEIPIYIMTSENNFIETKRYFEDNNYFGKKRSVIFFNQEEGPVFDLNKKVIINDNKILMASCGHGNVFNAMDKNNIFEDLQKRNIKWLLITGIDNILMKPVDLFSLGLIIDNNKDSIGKSTSKLYPEEKMGIFCIKNNKIEVVEYTEISKKDLFKTNNASEYIYDDAHLLWNIYNVNAIKKITKNKVLYHTANKTIKLNNKKIDIIKLEYFIFDYFKYLNDMLILKVNRDEEFAPIKNKVGIDSPETAYEIYNKYINSIKEKNV